MPIDPDTLYDEELVGRIRRLEAKKAKIEREIFLLRQLRAENEKRIVPRRVRLRKSGLGRVAAHNRIVRFLEDHDRPVASKMIVSALRKADPDLKPSTFRSHMKRLTDAGVLKQEGARGYMSSSSEKATRARAKASCSPSPTDHARLSEKPAKRRRTPAEQRAEVERVAREHGANLSEEGFKEALRKVAKSPAEKER